MPKWESLMVQHDHLQLLVEDLGVLGAQCWEPVQIVEMTGQGGSTSRRWAAIMKRELTEGKVG